MRINEFRLRDAVTDYEIKEQEIEYAGVMGIAELLGWQIICFRPLNDLVNTVVISFDEIDSDEFIDIANRVLKIIDVNIKFGDNIDIINNVYGIADFTDSLYEDVVRYNYMITSNLFMAFGLKDKALWSLEIITDEKMIKEIISVRKM